MNFGLLPWRTLFQDFDSEKRKVICKTLRFVAHIYGASLQVGFNTVNLVRLWISLRRPTGLKVTAILCLAAGDAACLTVLTSKM